jgi:hypothetical protein
MYDKIRFRCFSVSLVSYIAPLRCNQFPPFLKLTLHKSALFLASLHNLFRLQGVVKCSDTLLRKLNLKGEETGKKEECGYNSSIYPDNRY